MDAATTAHIDPITFEVIRHKLWSINEEGSATMVHVSGSPVVHATDYNFGIYAADGEMAVIGVYLLVPIYTGFMAIRSSSGVSTTSNRTTCLSSTIPTWRPSIRTTCSSARRFSTMASWWRGSAAWRIRWISAAWTPAAGARPRPTSSRRGFESRQGASSARGKINQELWDIIIANSRMPVDRLKRFQRVPGGTKSRQAATGGTVRSLRRRDGDACHAAVDRDLGEASLRNASSRCPDGVFEHVSYPRPSGPAKGDTLLVSALHA